MHYILSGLRLENPDFQLPKGETGLSAADGLEKRGLPVKLHFWTCLEGLIPLDLQEATQDMSSTTMTIPVSSKRAKTLNVQRLREHRLCRPENDLVDPYRTNTCGTGKM